MKTIILGILFFMVLALAGCGSNKDAEVDTFVADMDKLAGQIVTKVNANPTASGIDEAQKILDKQKSDLKARYDKLKELRGYELSEAVMKKFTDSVAKNIETIGGLQIQHAEQTVGDEAFGKKMNKLYTDFNSIFGV
jgi:predicted component of type VI protein secretion system